MEAWRVIAIRWSAAVALLAAAAGLGLFTLHEVDRFGGGFFPGLCAFAALLLATAGVGLPFAKAREFMLTVTCFVADLLML
jgi:hypothetical protein